MKITTISDRFSLTCPCCGDPVQIQIEKYDDGKKIVSIIHKDSEPIDVDLSQFGLEFGILEGGEITNGENANISVKSDD